jgi:hypothetical protein
MTELERTQAISKLAKQLNNSGLSQAERNAIIAEKNRLVKLREKR